MLPQTQPRKRRNSSKVNLLISFAFHAALVVVVLFFAARQGWLGEPLKKISVQLVKEKPPEKPPTPPKPIEPPKEIPKPVAPPKVVEAPKMAPPSAPVVAPPSPELPSFDFAGGAPVETSSDPVQLYKGFLEYTLRSKWNRPDNIADDNFVAEVELTVSNNGNIGDPQWKKNSGDARWDASVQHVFEIVKNIGRPPPTNFPPHIIIRFDVQTESETILQ